MPLDGSVWFKYDPQQNAANCKDADLAQFYASRWTNKTYTGQLTAIDLNNVACAFLWKIEPNLAQAHTLFTEASAKSPGTIQTIEDNKRRVEQLLGRVPPIRAPQKKGGGGGGGSWRNIKIRVPARRSRRG
jgi:hypothetical protein